MRHLDMCHLHLLSATSRHVTLLGACFVAMGCHETAPPSQPPGAPAGQVVVAAPAGGAAGAPVVSQTPPPVAVNQGQCPSQLLLDDLEDGDSAIVAKDQRSGAWSTFADTIGSSVQPAGAEPFRAEAPGAEGSKLAVRIHGKTAPHGNVYAGVGFWFTQDKAPYDASCCKGISFRAKRAKGSLDSVRLKVGDTNTLPEGHVCKSCYNDFGVDLGFGEEWKLYRIPFENMRQSPGWGESRPAISTTSLLQVQWQVSHPNFEYDIWIDDVALWDCTPKP